MSWIGKDREANTRKATDLVRMAVEKLRRDTPLHSRQFPVTKRVLVIGGGGSGLVAAVRAQELSGKKGQLCWRAVKCPAAA